MYLYRHILLMSVKNEAVKEHPVYIASGIIYMIFSQVDSCQP